MPKSRIDREKVTIRFMIELYCTRHHLAANKGSGWAEQNPRLCHKCEELYAYALTRLDKCPFQNAKPTCGGCRIHCYRPEHKSQIQVVMRYAGPRMLLKHPVLAMAHLLDTFSDRRKRD